MTRRGNGEGSIYEQRPGLWAAAITVHLSSGGRVRKTYYGKTRRIVQEKLAAATSARQHGALALERPTIAEYFERWLSRERRVRTAASYSSYARNHIAPALGHLHLDELGVHDVADLLQEKLDSGLSAQSVGHIRAVLRAALSEAEREELVFRNVAKIAKLPAPVEQYEGRVLNLEEAQRFLAAAEGDRLVALYRVILPLGLRTGEALALRWEDVDLEARTVHVRHTLQLVRRADRKVRGAGEGLVAMPTKTRRSKQKLPIPEICVRALRGHRARQLEERMAAGTKWQDTGYVFTTARGAPPEPSAPSETTLIVRTLSRSPKASMIGPSDNRCFASGPGPYTAL